jgi:hypothetical protein
MARNIEILVKCFEKRYLILVKNKHFRLTILSKIDTTKICPLKSKRS